MAYRKGITVQLGMIATQVDLESATVAEESLKTVCVGDGTTSHQPTAVRQSYRCPECGNEERSDFKKARVEGKNLLTVVEAEEVAQAREDSIGFTKSIIQLSAHPANEVRTQTVQDKSSVYYLTPSNVALAPLYGVVVDAILRHPELAFLGLWTPVSRPALYEVRVFGDSTLILSPLCRTESLKIKAQTPVPIPDANQQQIDALLANLTAAYDPATYADTYKVNLDALMASKTAEQGVLGERAKSAPKVTAAGAVDLTALLNGALGSAA